ncbi:MAG: DegT/DnrJ/EryC1/StrS aminotransferase family protein [Pseudomonadota bacterium]|nr:DegT/DnrJ/EryC1/StrS aminotransferase family protein [Pseudomonadota bacterium]
MEPVEFLPFTRPHIDAATIDAVRAVLASGWITSGPKVLELEATLSTLFGGRPVRAFANGTATMEVALRLAGIGPGDEVITTAVTWVATANVIVAVGARPVFVDIDPRTRNIDLAAVEAAITTRTRAILPVYLAGLPVDMDRLYGIADRHGLRVIEDAAQAIDSRWHDRRIGSFGDFASFSMHANKNITSAEGGFLVMASAEDAVRAERLRMQGVIRDGLDGMDVEEPGGKSNLTDINAVIGLGQLKHLDSITARRTELAEAYFEQARACGLEALGIELPPAADGAAATGAVGNWHMFQVLLPVERIAGARAAVMRELREAGIGTGVHYPALHLFSYYRSLGWREGMLPHAERVGRSLLTLPLFPAMQTADVERVCRHLADTCKRLCT